MPRLYVPEIGDQMRLTAPWSFTLFDEYRNRAVWAAFECDALPDVIARKGEYDRVSREWNDAIETLPRHPFTRRFVNEADQVRVNELQDRMRDLRIIPASALVMFPAETVLKVDRIYIRKGGSDFSSLSFFVMSAPVETIAPTSPAGGFKRGDKVSATRLPGHPVLRIRTPDLLMIRWASEQALDAAGALQLND